MRTVYPLPRIRVEGTSWRCRVCGRAKHTLVAWQEGTQAPREPFWDRSSMLSDVCPRCRDWLNTA